MIVLDTCTILWDSLAPDQLSNTAAKAIVDADERGEIIIADISCWEVAMLVSKGRVQIDTGAARFLQLFLQSRQVKLQAITPEIAELSVNLHSSAGTDPADRIIAATAIMHNAALVTADQRLRGCKAVTTLW